VGSGRPLAGWSEGGAPPFPKAVPEWELGRQLVNLVSYIWQPYTAIV